MLLSLNYWMLQVFNAKDVIVFHVVNVIIFEVLDVTSFKCRRCFYLQGVISFRVESHLLGVGDHLNYHLIFTAGVSSC